MLNDTKEELKRAFREVVADILFPERRIQEIHRLLHDEEVLLRSFFEMANREPAARDKFIVLSAFVGYLDSLCSPEKHRLEMANSIEKSSFSSTMFMAWAGLSTWGIARPSPVLLALSVLPPLANAFKESIMIRMEGRGWAGGLVAEARRSNGVIEKVRDGAKRVLEEIEARHPSMVEDIRRRNMTFARAMPGEIFSSISVINILKDTGVNSELALTKAIGVWGRARADGMRGRVRFEI